jgi:hypothetical protein
MDEIVPPNVTVVVESEAEVGVVTVGNVFTPLFPDCETVAAEAPPPEILMLALSAPVVVGANFTYIVPGEEPL